MKKTYIIILAFLSIIVTNKLFSQAVVNDKDGYVNVRSESNMKSKIIDTLHNGHIIFPLEKEGIWREVDYYKNGEILSGYVYDDRTKEIVGSFPEIERKKFNENEIVLGNNSIEILVSQRKFEPKNHTFTYDKKNKTLITLIDNKIYYGKDGGMPSKEYYEIKVKIADKIIQFPKTATENLYEPSLNNILANYDKEQNIIYISSINSDGAGSYIVVWKIKKGKYEGRYVFYGF